MTTRMICAIWLGIVSANAQVDDTTHFTIPATMNSRSTVTAVAVLRLNEVNPNLPTSRDLIELIVIASGNTGGIIVQQGLGTPTALDTMPAVDVAVDDIILIHSNPSGSDAPASETVTKNQYPSSSYANYDAAWDFLGTTSGVTFSNQVLLVKSPDGSIQDAVPFTKTSSTPTAFPGDLDSIQALGLWLPSNCGGIPCSYSSTPTAQSVSVDWTTVAITVTGNSIQRITDTKGKSDWTIAASSFGILNAGEVLPVELTYLSARAIGFNAELFWRTATETNSYGFDIERRAVGHSLMSVSQTRMSDLPWKKTGFVEGAGTSGVPKEYSFIDKNLYDGQYSYRLKQIDRDGKFEYSTEVEIMILKVPKEFSVMQNYPNPFNPTTTIRYSLPSSANVKLVIYDLLGREIATLVNEEQSAGWKEVEWNAKDVSSGIYFYKITAGDYVGVKKLMLLK